MLLIIKYKLTFAGIFFCLLAAAQDNEIAKLKFLLSKSANDTNKLKILDALIENTNEDSIWIPYNEQLGKTALELIKSDNPKIKLTAKKYYGSYFNNLGYAAENSGNTAVALDNYYKSLKIHEEIKDEAGISTVLNNIGYLKNSQGDKQEALVHFERSLSLQRKLADSAGMALSMLNIGSIFDDYHRTDSALYFYKLSYAVSAAINDKYKQGMVLSNIGSLYDKADNMDSAMLYYRQGLALQESIDDKEGIATSLINFGNIYLKQKNYSAAQQSFERSMSIAREIGYIKLMRGAALWLSKIYALRNNYKGAYEMHLLYKQLADSISNDETRKQAVKRQMQYEYEKREAMLNAEHDKKEALATKEIEKQRLVKTIIIVASVILFILLVFGFYNFYSKRREKFRKTVEQVNNKALRAQMNPHFIFNSLNSIQDFINSNDSKNANTYIVKFAKLVRMILENSRKQEVLLSEDLRALELYMQLESLRLHHGFDYEIKIDSGIDKENTLIPPLIIQPFVENSIWHGLQHKQERGKISINISRKNDELEWIVEDNGVGRVAAMEVKSVSPVKKNKSLGMEITRERIKLYNSVKNTNAFFEVTDIVNAENAINGMRVILHLPFEEAN